MSAPPTMGRVRPPQPIPGKPHHLHPPVAPANVDVQPPPLFTITGVVRAVTIASAGLGFCSGGYGYFMLLTHDDRALTCALIALAYAMGSLPGIINWHKLEKLP